VHRLRTFSCPFHTAQVSHQLAKLAFKRCMTEKKDSTHILVPNTLVVFVRPRSTVWQCRYQVDGNWLRESTKERDLEKAKAVAHDLLIDAI
jgi:hypothetical protein